MYTSFSLVVSSEALEDDFSFLLSFLEVCFVGTYMSSKEKKILPLRNKSLQMTDQLCFNFFGPSSHGKSMVSKGYCWFFFLNFFEESVGTKIDESMLIQQGSNPKTH